MLVTSEEKIHAVGMQQFSCDDLIGNSVTNAAADFAAASEQHDELDVLRIDWIRVRVMLVHRRLVAIFNGVQEVSPSWRLRSLPNHLTEPRSRSLSKAWTSPHVALLLISAWSLATVEGSPSCYRRATWPCIDMQTLQGQGTWLQVYFFCGTARSAFPLRQFPQQGPLRTFLVFREASGLPVRCGSLVMCCDGERSDACQA